jgi:O-antigen/teichoic acid export membrane protein
MSSAAFLEIRSRAVRAVIAVAGRGVVVQVLAASASIVLARRLAPTEVGALAVGLSITGLASALADGGLAAGLIRSPAEPSLDELRCALGLQLALMSILALIAIGATAPFGRIGLITSIMVIALPLTAFQTPAKVLLERDLKYRKVAAVEVAESLAFFGWMSATLVAGWGVWGPASASIVRAVVSGALLLLWVPRARLVPRVDRARSASLLAFGIRFQAVNLANLVRDQGLNAAVGLILGLPALGVWTLASRVLQVPMMLFGSLWRVSYPVMTRIVGFDPRPRDLLERSVVYGGLGGGLLLSVAASISPELIPILFGSRWAGASNVVVPTLFALVIGAPVALATGGYLFARGDVGSVLKSTVLHTVAWFAVSVPLLYVIGVPAIGVGHLVGATVDAVVLGRAAERLSGASLLVKTWPTTLAALLATAAGWTTGQLMSVSTLAALAAGSVATIVYLVAAGLLVQRFLSIDLRLVAKGMKLRILGPYVPVRPSSG